MNRKGILKNFLMRFCDNFDQEWAYIDLDTDDLILDILKALSIYDYSVLYSVGTNTNELCDVLDISLDLLRLSSKQILLLLDKKKNIREGDKNLVNFIKTLDNLFNKDDSIELLYQDLLMLDDLLFKLFDKKSIISNIKFLRLFINSLFKKIYSIKSLYKCYETVEDDFLIYLDKFILSLTSVRLIKEDPEIFMVIMLNTNWKFDTDYMSISLDVLYSKDIFNSFLESLITKYIDNNLLIIFYVKLMFSLIYLENNVDRHFLGIIKSLLMKFSEINSIMIINNPGFRSKDISQKIMGYFLLFNGVNNSIDNIKLFGFNENLEIRDRLNLLGSSLWLSNEINTVTFTGTVCDMLATK